MDMSIAFHITAGFDSSSTGVPPCAGVGCKLPFGVTSPAQGQATALEGIHASDAEG